MREVKRDNRNIASRLSKQIDDVVGIVSPKAAYRRRAYRFAYDAIGKRRLSKKRKGLGGTGDTHLTEGALYELREKLRDMGRNNGLVKGLLKTERDGVIGSTTMVQARTPDEGWNEQAEAAFKEEMVDKPCDVTGRFGFHDILRKSYLGYRRDGDIFCLFTPDGPQMCEGEQVGKPFGKADGEHFTITNGIAFSKKTKRVIGYYIGKPHKTGYYIDPATYKQYKADKVHHMFNSDRFSYSRGEPALSSVINSIETLTDYIDAELVAAKVNACFSMFISRKDGFEPQAPFTKGVQPSGYAPDTGNRLEKMEPGTIMYGFEGESATGIGQTRPGALFDPFVLRMLTIIGRPLLMPLMLITLDFSGATFMNARIAYQKVQGAWTDEQNVVVKPFGSGIWRWHIDRMIKRRVLTDIKEKYRHEITCNRWPYVDPFKEAKADEFQLNNKATTRTIICARQGHEFIDIAAQLGKEEEILKKNNLAEVKDPPQKKDEDGKETE